MPSTLYPASGRAFYAAILLHLATTTLADHGRDGTVATWAGGSSGSWNSQSWSGGNPGAAQTIRVCPAATITVAAPSATHAQSLQLCDVQTTLRVERNLCIGP